MKALLSSLLFAAVVLPVGAMDNQLTETERAEGWELLFDGKSLTGWRGYGVKEIPPGWEVRDGTLRTVMPSDAAARAGGGAHPPGIDLITERTFTDFELCWEWRVSTGGNNGLKYFVREDRPSAPGHEYQMMDDIGDPIRAWRGDVHRLASFYDVVPAASDKPLRPAGVWNTSKLVVKGNLVEHWLNGVNVVAYELGSEEVKRGLARSKFKDEPGFGEKHNGPILLVAATQPGRECWIRNIKVKRL